MDGGRFDTTGGRGKDGTVLVAVFMKEGSQGSMRAAAAEGVPAIGFLLLEVVVVVTVDKKVVGGAEVLKGKLCLSLLMPLLRVPRTQAYSNV